MDNEITIENLKEVKKIIFDNNITEEEKEKIINNIKKTVEEILSEFESESDPIDE